MSSLEKNFRVILPLEKQCYPGATLCERFTKRENYPEWLKCVSVTSGSRREDNPLVERCYDYYEWRELSEKVEEEEATSLYRNHSMQICKIVWCPSILLFILSCVVRVRMTPLKKLTTVGIKLERTWYKLVINL